MRLLLSLAAILLEERELHFCESCGREMEEGETCCEACGDVSLPAGPRPVADEDARRVEASLVPEPPLSAEVPRREVTPKVRYPMGARLDGYAARPEDMMCRSRSQVAVGRGAALAIVGSFRPWVTIFLVLGFEGFFLPTGQAVLVMAVASLVLSRFMEREGWAKWSLAAVTAMGAVMISLVLYQLADMMPMMGHFVLIGDGPVLIIIGSAMMIVAGVRRLRRGMRPVRRPSRQGTMQAVRR